MEEIEIVRATVADRDAIVAMYIADMADLGARIRRDDLESLVDQTLANEGVHCHVFVARVGSDEPVAVLLADPFWSLKVSGRALWIEELYVKPEHRRRGLGRRMVETLLDWAEQNGFRGVELESYHMNTAASVLYRTLGFRRLARERYLLELSPEPAKS